jgi:hypothetical protein
MEPVNIVCMKWGTLYGPEYVNILYGMVKRNITLPFRFICMTEIPDNIRPEVEITPLPVFREPVWEYARYCSAWRKLALFDRQVLDLKGKLMFLDLDVVIVGNIDCFFSFSDRLAIIENWSQKGRLIGQSSVFCFEIGTCCRLLEKYNTRHDEVMKNNRTEQMYITRELGKDNFEYFPKEWCKSFKMHCMPGGILNSFITPTRIPKDARIIVFHGNPNPPDAMAGIWGSPVKPWFKKTYKTVKPTRWIADYWY